MRLVLMVETGSPLELSSSPLLVDLQEIVGVITVIAGDLPRIVLRVGIDPDVALVCDLIDTFLDLDLEGGDPGLGLVVTGERDLEVTEDIHAHDPDSVGELGVLDPGLIEDLEDQDQGLIDLEDQDRELIDLEDLGDLDPGVIEDIDLVHIEEENVHVREEFIVI